MTNCQRSCPVNLLAVLVQNVIDNIGVDTVTAVGQHGIGLGDVQHAHHLSAQRQRQVAGETGCIETEAADVFQQFVDSQLLQQAD